MENFITFVGLDVHKETISAALAEGGDRGEARVYGEIANRPDALRKLMSSLAHDSRDLRFCYEAGPCGYGIQRQLTDAGHDCVVVAPALIPKKPGDRIKTNRRDALKLSRLHRAGELTSVWVPDPAHEAMRDLVRARLAAAMPVSSSRVSCYAKDDTIAARRGVRCIAGGWQIFVLSRQPIMLCSRI